MDVEVGKVTYTQWLNERGGIEADLTISKTAEDTYAVVTGIGSLVLLHATRCVLQAHSILRYLV